MGNHLFDAIAQSHSSGEATFIETASGVKTTYDDMMRLSARMANAIDSLGVRPGDRVAAQVDKSVEALGLYLACLRCGAIFLPLNTAYTLSELDYFISDATPRLIVVAPASLNAIRPTAEMYGALVETLGADGSGSLMDLSAEEAIEFVDASRGPDDLAAILYTSGTTGRSKGAMLSHDNLLSNARALASCWHMTSADRLIHALPIFHTHGLFVATNVTLIAGASMFLLAKFDPEEIVSLMQKSTLMMGVPTFYVRLLQSNSLTRDAVSSMRLFISGSAPLLTETHLAFQERTGHAILERYGMTETNMNTSNPYHGDRIAGSVGLPLPGIDVRITDPATGQVLGTEETGMIEILGPNVFKGYWRMPEKTQTEFREDGYFISGDLGKIDANGYVYIVGRGKDLVISGGYNIYPKEVESEIDLIPGVLESAVVGVPHPDFGEGVIAIVVLQSKANVSEKTILSALSDRLARYKQPKRVFFLNELPRNTMSKVQKNLLREKFVHVFRESRAVNQ